MGNIYCFISVNSRARRHISHRRYIAYDSIYRKFSMNLYRCVAKQYKNILAIYSLTVRAIYFLAKMQYVSRDIIPRYALLRYDINLVPEGNISSASAHIESLGIYRKSRRDLYRVIVPCTIKQPSPHGLYTETYQRAEFSLPCSHSL